MAFLARLRTDIMSLYKGSPHPDIILSEEGPTDLTNVTVHLLGPASTPYSEGAWKVRLVIPTDYPNSPPKAYFDTKIFHPNVQPSSGEVCVDTLKRDWSSQVDLRHVLLVIRCLLIEPNPESALNEEAGKLLLENFKDYERMARLMTTVHALKRSSFVTPVTASTADSSSSSTDGTISGNAADSSSTKIYSDAEQASQQLSVDKNVLRPLEHTQRGAPGSPVKSTKPKKKVGMKRL
ncbi:ubiquitin-conjugating enzyme [Myxozyma melibiosi]|uniref:Ubiquitin-conjugating enzyme n=1 Tax=Myxozyma melibiosi TaxID=54550 RepID=A0ABR1FCY7_9ASCO